MPLEADRGLSTRNRTDKADDRWRGLSPEQTRVWRIRYKDFGEKAYFGPASPAAGPTTIDLTGLGLDHGKALGTGPKVNPTIVVTGLTHTRAQGAFVLDTFLKPASLVHTRGTSTPQVNPQLRPASIVHTRTLGTTSVTANFTLLPASLVHTRGTSTPQVNPQLRPASIVHTRGTSSPQINPKLSPAGLVHTRGTSSPKVIVILSPAGLVHSRTLGAPKVNPKIVMTGLVHGKTLGQPSFLGAFADGAHTHSIHPHQHRDGDSNP